MKKIFDGVFDDGVHVAFLKFGRGGYRNKYLLNGKRQAKNWSVKAGAEYANFLVRRCLEKVGAPLDSLRHQTGQGLVAVKGVIVSTLDLRDEIEFEISKVKNFQGVRKHVVNSEVEPADVFALMDKYPKAFFALTFKGDGFVLKIKPKAPASGKPGKGGDKPVADFCSLKTEDRGLVDELFFGVGDFGEVSVNHAIEVNDIVYPANMEELKPSEVRELAKRKGVVVRNVVVDGVEKVSRAEFVV